MFTERTRTFRTNAGLATLGPDAVRIRNALETKFTQWAGEAGALSMLFPPLTPVSDLAMLDYFKNFPHLMVCACTPRAEVIRGSFVDGDGLEEIPADHLRSSQYVLPSAACYSVYLHFRDLVLEDPLYVTTAATCFRNEEAYAGLKRLWSFSMREVVCVGDQAVVQAHLGAFKTRILGFAQRIGLPLEVAVATDPFFDKNASRAVMQRLFPVKEEFVYGGSVAIASVNFHRNFFGEKCEIRLADGSFAQSGCAAFGLERWIHALTDHFQGDVERIMQALER